MEEIVIRNLYIFVEVAMIKKYLPREIVTRHLVIIVSRFEYVKQKSFKNIVVVVYYTTSSLIGALY